MGSVFHAGDYATAVTSYTIFPYTYTKGRVERADET